MCSVASDAVNIVLVLLVAFGSCCQIVYLTKCKRVGNVVDFVP